MSFWWGVIAGVVGCSVVGLVVGAFLLKKWLGEGWY